MRVMKRYANPYIKNIRRGLLDFVRWQLGHYDDILPVIEPSGDFVYPRVEAALDESLPHVTWIGHCTFLLEAHGKRILTDPIWSQRCSPLFFFGPKRKHAPPMAISELPEIDIVLISHNHYDHLDEKTVKALNDKFPRILWVVPMGLKSWFEKKGVRRVRELLWWQESVIPFDDLRIVITSVPAQHYSGRGFLDLNKTLWMGHVVRFFQEEKLTKCFYFVGDTAYNAYDFKKIGERFQKIDLCLCPIGTYKPGRFMRTVHSNPEDAVSIHQEVRSRLSVGMHWKTFRLSNEHMNQPPFDLYQEMIERGLNPTRFVPLEPGEKINW